MSPCIVRRGGSAEGSNYKLRNGMKNQIIFLLGFVLAAISGAEAQEPLRREVDVTRDYEPAVREFLKLGTTPDMADTAQMRPDFNYEITPRPLSYDFSVVPINPAQFSASRQVQMPGYLRLGVGYPLQTSADFRYLLKPSDRIGIGLLGNHYGRWAKIENDMAVEEKATATENRAGAWVDFRPVETLFFKLDLGYDYRHVYRYGYFYSDETDGHVPLSKFETSDDVMKQNHRRLKTRLSLGTLDSEMPVNVRLGMGLESFMDRYRYDQVRFGLDFAVDFRAGANGRASLSGETTLNRGRNNLKGVKNPLGRFDAAYEMRKDGLWLRLGAGFGFAENRPAQAGRDSSRIVFLPQLILEKELCEGRVIPFAHIRSTLTDNSYAALVDRNPYLYSGQQAPHTVSYTGRGGIRGTLDDRFRYTVYGGYTLQKDAAFWANAYSGIDSPANAAAWPFYGNQGNVFTVLTDDLNYFEAGIDFQFDLRSALTWTGALNWRSYSADNFAEAWGLPALTASTGLSYNHRDRLYLNAGIAYTGKRHMVSHLTQALSNQLPGQADLTFGVDYFVNRQLGVFLQLNNLLNQKLYEFNRYPELGLNGLIGIKLSF